MLVPAFDASQPHLPLATLSNRAMQLLTPLVPLNTLPHGPAPSGSTRSPSNSAIKRAALPLGTFRPSGGRHEKRTRIRTQIKKTCDETAQHTERSRTRVLGVLKQASHDSRRRLQLPSRQTTRGHASLMYMYARTAPRGSPSPNSVSVTTLPGNPGAGTPVDLGRFDSKRRVYRVQLSRARRKRRTDVFFFFLRDVPSSRRGARSASPPRRVDRGSELW